MVKRFSAVFRLISRHYTLNIALSQKLFTIKSRTAAGFSREFSLTLCSYSSIIRRGQFVCTILPCAVPDAAFSDALQMFCPAKSLRDHRVTHRPGIKIKTRAVFLCRLRHG